MINCNTLLINLDQSFIFFTGIFTIDSYICIFIILIILAIILLVVLLPVLPDKKPLLDTETVGIRGERMPVYGGKLGPIHTPETGHYVYPGKSVEPPIKVEPEVKYPRPNFK